MKTRTEVALTLLLLCMALSPIQIAADENDYKWSDYEDYTEPEPGFPTKGEAVKATYASASAQKQLAAKKLPTKNFFAFVLYTFGKSRVNATIYQPHDSCTFLFYVHFPKAADGSHLWAPCETIFMRDVSGSKPGPWVVKSVEYVLDQQSYPHTIDSRDIDITEMKLRE